MGASGGGAARLAGVVLPEPERDTLARLRMHAEKLVAPARVTALAERVAQGSETRRRSSPTSRTKQGPGVLEF